MKLYIRVLGIIVLFSSGINSAMAQERINKEVVVSEDLELTPAYIAKLQTQDLKQLLSLDDAQAIKVYDAMLNVEQNMVAIVAAGISEEAKMVEIQKWEVHKTEKLKKILTNDQFTRYLNTVKSDKR